MMTWPVAAGSLLLGFAVAEATGVRALGGVVLFAGCLWCGLRWLRSVGAARTALLVVVYLAAFALSHVVGKLLGAWPSVLLVSALVGVLTYRMADRPAAAR